MYYQGLPFVPKTIWIKILSRQHNYPLLGYFGIDKNKDLVGQKYY